MRRQESGSKRHAPRKIFSAFRGLEFWRRATGIYLSYKVAQTRASILRVSGKSEAEITDIVWNPQNRKTGQHMYDLCVDLRGFYLKAGQFLGTRADFIPEDICKHLSKLHDQVPPMPKHDVERILRRELGVQDLSMIFDEIELEAPLGSASIAQVHRGRLRNTKRSLFQRLSSIFDHQQYLTYVIQENEEAWDICNTFGISQRELKRANRKMDISTLRPEDIVRIPVTNSTPHEDSTDGGSVGMKTREAARRAMHRRDRPADGRVAIKIQYPDGLEIMKQDLGNVRAWADFLSKTEIQFDMVSAVDELRKQIELEFDFTREARVMDSISIDLQPISSRVVVPRSVPGLVTRHMLIMTYMDGIPLKELSRKTASLTERQQRQAKERILHRICEAYGKMIFGSGLFQADGHPGNILVQKGARIALLDYGQSKKLTKAEVYNLSHLIIAIAKGDPMAMTHALERIGVEFGSDSPELKLRMAVGMFDTKGIVDPFDKDSPLKRCRISRFPPDLFFVLRVVQLIRGIKQGMKVDMDFSSAKIWNRYATHVMHRTAESLGRND